MIDSQGLESAQWLVEGHAADISERQVERYVAAERREIGEVEAFVPPGL